MVKIILNYLKFKQEWYSILILSAV